MISVYRITLGIRTGFLSITEKPNKTGIFCNPRNWARGVPARRSSVTATRAPKNQPSSGTREYGFQRFRNRDLPRSEFAPFPLSPPIRRLVSHLANRLTHRERRCAASGKARDRGVLYSTARERNAAGARGLSPEGSAAEAKRMRRQTAKDDRARRRRTPGTPSRAQGVRQRAGGADRAAGAGRPQGCLFCCDKRFPGCVGRARRLPASPRVSLVSRRNPSGDRPPAAAFECQVICETGHYSLNRALYGSPKKPCGRMARISRMMEYAIRSRSVEGKIMATKISVNPSKKPASGAPITDPLPPRMAATNAFQPNTIPIYGSNTG